MLCILAYYSIYPNSLNILSGNALSLYRERYHCKEHFESQRNRFLLVNICFQISNTDYNRYTFIVIVIAVGNEHGDTSSNPGRD